MLSVIPGLGQFYNGQSVKGFLFMDVAVVNAVLLLIVLFAEPISAGLRNLLTGNHVKPNDGVLNALASAHLGTPFSLVLVSMMLLFVGFAVRDAYDFARGEKLKPIYADSALHLSEAASGSYLFHFAAMISCAIFALFFLIPKPEVQQVTEIEFTETPIKDVEPVKAKKFSNESSSARHREKPVEKPTPKTSSASQARSQPAHEAVREKTVTPPKQQTTPARQVVKAQSAKGEQTPVFKPMPRAFTPAKPQVNANPAPVPAPLAMASKAAASTAQPNVTPMPTPAKASTSNAPNPLLAFVPHVTAGPGPAPMALNRSSNAIVGGGPPMPAEAKRGSSASTIGNGPPAPMSATPGNSSSKNPSPVPGAHTGNPGQPTGTDSSTKPTKISALRPDGLGSVQPAVAPAGPASVPHIDRRGTDTERGIGKGDDNVKTLPDFGPYMAELQRPIKRNWQPPKDPNSRQVVVEFTIFKSGELGSVHISRSSGMSVNDQAAISAIRAAAPFMPLPKHADDSVDIQFTFDYRVFGGHASY
jgi:TonB family protein